MMGDLAGEDRVRDLMADLTESVAAAKKARDLKRRVDAQVQEALALHDAEHAYLDNGHPDVLACVWCQS